MPNLRSSGVHRLWDWHFLNGCFGETIKVSDIDGIVERKGKFLVIETKRENESMSDGQRYMLEAFCKQGHSVVVVVGNPETEEVADIELWNKVNGNIRIENRGDCKKDLVELCQSWYNYVNGS